MENEPLITRIDRGDYDGLQGLAQLKADCLSAMGQLYEDKFSFMAHQHSGMDDPIGRNYRKAILTSTFSMNVVSCFCTPGMQVLIDPIQALTIRGFYVLRFTSRLASREEIQKWGLPIGPSDQLTPLNQKEGLSLRVGEESTGTIIKPRTVPKMYDIRTIVRVATLADIVSALTEAGYVVHEARHKIANKADTRTAIIHNPIQVVSSTDPSKNKYAAGPANGVWL